MGGDGGWFEVMKEGMGCCAMRGATRCGLVRNFGPSQRDTLRNYNCVHGKYRVKEVVMLCYTDLYAWTTPACSSGIIKLRYDQNRLQRLLSGRGASASRPTPTAAFDLPSNCLRLSIFSSTSSNISFRLITSRCARTLGSSLANLSISLSLKCRPNLASSSRGKL